MTFRNPIVAGLNLIRTAIRSPNYVAGSSGWQVARAGDAEFNNVTARGTLTVTGSNDIIVTGTDGSEIQIGPVGSSAIMNIWPAPGPGGYYNAGQVAAGQGPPASLVLLAPTIGAADTQAWIGLYSSDPSDPSATIRAEADVFNIAFGDLQIGGVSQSRGRIAYAYLTAPSSNISTTETVVITVPSSTYTYGRAYQVRIRGQLASNTGAAAAILVVRKSNLAGAMVAGRYHGFTTDAATTGMLMPLAVDGYITPSGSSQNVPLVLTLASLSSTNTVYIYASSTAIASVEIWDVGAASDFPDAVQM